MQSDLNESIGHNALRDLIAPIVSIDQYKSKVGTDENVVVVAFKIKDKDPAEDLSQFIESGFKVLDVDVSQGPDSDGIYTVFVEVERDSKLFSVIDSILNDIKQVDNAIDAWQFTCYESEKVITWSKEAFDENIITSSYDYVIKHNPEAKQISERMKFLNKY
jgi:hypothetical protein